MFLGIPLSSQLKEGSFFYRFDFVKRSKKGDKISQNIAIIVQIRLFSAKRLLNKIGVIDSNDFNGLKKRLRKLIF
jgi:mRNA interferase MazF